MMQGLIDIKNDQTHLAITSAITLFNNMNSSVKTPVSLLQEICIKCRVQPIFEELSGEMSKLNETMFVYKLNVGDITSMGKGASKKKAKHNAAVCVLQEIRNKCTGVNDNLAIQIDELLKEMIANEYVFVSGKDVTNGVAGSLDESSANPVGELIEFTQRSALRPPEFEFGSEEGPPHAREFTCTVIFGEMTEVGVGRSKKDAKRHAALKLLSKIKLTDSYKQKQQQQTQPKANNLPKDQQKRRIGRERNQTIAKNLHHSSFDKLKLDDKPFLKNLALNDLRDDENDKNSKLLTDISNENSLECNIIRVPYVSKSGREQVFLELKLNPVTVFNGTGNTFEMAVHQSTYNALAYLKLLLSSKDIKV